MRDIAGDVGVEVASLYGHFPSKEDILWGIVRDAIDELESIHDVPAEPTAREDLIGFVRRHVAYHALNPQKARVVNNTIRSLSAKHFAAVRDFRDRYEARLRTILLSGNERGEFDIGYPKLTSYAVLQMGMAISDWFRADGPINVDELCKYYVDIALRLIQPPDDRALAMTPHVSAPVKPVRQLGLGNY